MTSHADQTETSCATIVPGACVLTAFGVAVVTKLCSGEKEAEIDNELPLDCLFQARLWRQPGKSIASSSIAYLRRDSVLKEMPAAPGMVTTFSCDDLGENCEILLHSYSASTDTYLGSLTDKSNTSPNCSQNENSESSKENVKPAQSKTDTSNLIVLKPSQIQPAKCSKFYPLMSDLMTRGDWAASAATSLVTSNSDALLETSSNVISNVGVTNKDASKKAGEVSVTATKALQSVVPDAEKVQQIVTMLKDEELTDLLEKGRERLKQLMSNDIPQATEKALEEVGISFKPADADSESSLKSAIIGSREKALTAIDDLLATHAKTNVETLTKQLGEQFSDVFDNLSTAARSDVRLNSIFETISEKTSEWQEATGRVLSTRSASLFFEGSRRLQARAANLFSPEQLKWARECRMKLTKGFTEGDAAVAKLKSIELGDVVRARLFAAIELRSGSKDGLDGIIAGALTSINSEAVGGAAEDGVQMMLAKLQTSASSATMNAHETLISTLSRKCQYRDQAMNRIEEVLVNLEKHLGQDMTAEEIALIARGEGGTAALFDPIARRAAKEIDKQLDSAEENVSDPTILTVLGNVRKIISGDLSVMGLTDEIVKFLNEDTSVAAGEGLLMRGERLLDVLENASQNKLVSDVMGVVERAGLTKDSLFQRLENIDVNKVVETAETAVTDEAKRQELLSSAADAALDFLLRILPKMPVPPFDGVKDGLLYHLSNLSMEGFKVKKEDIMVEIAGIRAVKRSVSVDVNPSSDSPVSNNVKLLDTEESEKEFLATSPIDEEATNEEESDEAGEPEKKTVNATELLIIDVRNISAVLDDPLWSFEQTYFPYLKGSGNAFAQLSEGSIRLQFELRKRKIANDEEDEEEKWEPVLCLHEYTCCIREIDLKLKGEGKITWILNKLSSYFRGPLCNYVVQSVQRTLGNGSGVLLEKLNDSLGNYWDLIMRTAGLKIEDLAEVSDGDVVKASVNPQINEVELVWREQLPLGMNLLMNDGSGLVKVVEFPRGSQARNVVEQIKLNPDSFKGSTITAVNGIRYDETGQDDLVEALRDPGRPKTITFMLADSEEAERIRVFCAGMDGKGEIKNNKSDVVEGSQDETQIEEFSSTTIKTVSLAEEGPLGIQFSNSLDDFSLVVEGFSKGVRGEILAAEETKIISVGDVLVSINGECVLGKDGSGRSFALELFETHGATRPLVLAFAGPYLRNYVFTKSPDDLTNRGGPMNELIFEERKLPDGQKKVALKKFEDVASAVEAAQVFIGDHLISMNGDDVGAALRGHEESRNQFEVTLAKMRNSESYPMILIFARPDHNASRWFATETFNVETATKFTVTVNNPNDLGCEFAQGKDPVDIIVKDFHAVKGPIQNWLASAGNIDSTMGMVVEAVNGQVVPSYATCSMVTKALERSWTENGSVEILFIDDERKKWLQSFEKGKSDDKK
mmetsp:Transcript_10633/g.15556  ORF Transcript_10633/g.15556 Transcript_10633/m.15556 type:complete len:1439 (-) Transcript_10633:229-4545(-)|eukprot:CAMPEP_0195520774 /NCGR_PEP_ID=MMETSP0794_2-20130614/17535_1 /TAXON_ID=515487 /ORGANISM="Stephanopyxis turris, Strain CCMP 815" /LENGTH=1438 /DNA_ID=CAMNT_0040650195 /DNA_START=8 /DNA_END=4324 /DNA_ORIENTATION=-